MSYSNFFFPVWKPRSRRRRPPAADDSLFSFLAAGFSFSSPIWIKRKEGNSTDDFISDRPLDSSTVALVIRMLLVRVYLNVFSVDFWFVILLGNVGIILYTLVDSRDSRLFGYSRKNEHQAQIGGTFSLGKKKERSRASSSLHRFFPLLSNPLFLEKKNVKLMMWWRRPLLPILIHYVRYGSPLCRVSSSSSSFSKSIP